MLVKVRTRTRALVFWFGAASAISLAPTAAAQAVFDDNIVREGPFGRDRNISVRERPRPLYASLPYRAGPLLVSPQVAAGVEVNDNVFADDLNESSDVIYRLQPAVAARTNWSRHQVDAFARASVARFADSSSENTTDWAMGARGRYDIARGAAVQAGASHEYLTEPRTSSESPDFLAEPIRYEVDRLFIGGVKNFNRLRIAGQVNYRYTDFENGDAPLGEDVYQDDRDRRVVTLAGRAEYAVSPAVSVFTEASVDRRNALNPLPDALDRDSDGFQANVGTNFDIGGLARGDVAVGYVAQDYADPTISDPSTYAVRGLLEYFPSQLVTVRLTAARTVEDSVRQNAGGFVATNLGVQADYEFRRNLILTGNLAWNRDGYRGLDRVNTRLVGTVSANYLLNRAVGLSLALQRYDQESSGSQPGREYLINRVVATLIYQFGIN